MRQVIRQTAGHGFAEIEELLAYLCDLLWIAAGAVFASLIFGIDAEHRAVEGSLVLIDIALAILLLPRFGAYELRGDRSKWRAAINTVFGWIAVQACSLLILFLLHHTASVSWIWWVSWTVITAIGIAIAHPSVHAVLARLRRKRANLRTVAIVGDSSHCDEVLRRIERAPDSGFRAVATFNTLGVAQAGAYGLPSFTAVTEFAAWVRRERVDEVWLALRLSDERTAKLLLDEFSSDLVNLRFVPDVAGLAMFERNVVDLMGLPAINLMVSPMTPRALLQKAVFDRLFALVILLALSPLMLAIAVAIKATSKGPVLFTQRRMGADGREFRIYKFRSMHVHSEQPGVVRQATRNDARVTYVGAFLRRTSLDELPQFFNVLRGEMSVVGPRPHALEHDDHYRTVVDGYMHRYRIKPGITGWAQINGFRGETDAIEKMQGRVEHDLYYLRNWSFGLDMRIVIATAVKGLWHPNAY